MNDEAPKSGPRSLLKAIQAVLSSTETSERTRLNMMCRVVASNMVAEYATIYALGDDGNLTLIAQEGLPSDAIGMTVGSKNSIVGYSLEKLEPLTTSSLGEERFSGSWVKKHPSIVTNSVQSCAIIPIQKNGKATGALSIYNTVSREYREDELEALSYVSMIIAEYDEFTNSIGSRQMFRIALKRNDKEIAAILLMLASLIRIEVEHRNHKKPNDFQSDLEASEYDKSTDFLESIESSISIISDLLVENIGIRNAKAVDKSAEEVFDIRDSIDRWLKENGDEAVDVAARLPIIATIVGVLSFIGVPSTAAMIGALTMYSPEKTKNFLGDMIKRVKGD